jgi:hypothetical protein
MVGDEIYRDIRKNIIEKNLAMPGNKYTLVSPEKLDRIFMQLYSNPQLLKVIEQIIRAAGGYVSALVSSYMAFLYDVLKERGLTELGIKKEGDDFWELKLDSIIGDLEAKAQKTLPFYEVTVLGKVIEGSLPRNKKDPEKSDWCYQVDPGIDLGKVLLQPISGKLEKLPLSMFIRTALTHQIKELKY